MIYILNDFGEIVDTLEPNKAKPYWNDLHIQDLKEGTETFDFDCEIDIPVNSTIVLKTPRNELIPFTVQEVRKFSSYSKTFSYKCDAEFLELRYTKILTPETLIGQTPQTALSFALQGTRWSMGEIDYADSKDIQINEHMNTLKFMRIIAHEFSLELRFYVEFNHNKISRRYVDFKERTGLNNGKEIIFGKDLQSLERIEDARGKVSALYGIGPADSDGKYLGIETVNSGKPYVEDKAALKRWSKDGEHLFDVFTPSVNSEGLTPQKLLDLTKLELQRRIYSAVTYKVDAVDLYEVLGQRHEEVWLGDTVRIKDEKFDPALYLVARVLRTERSYSGSSKNQYILGDYREVNPRTYQYILDIQRLLNNRKGTWDSVVDVKDGLDQQTIKISEINQDIDNINLTVGEINTTTNTHSEQISQINLDVDGITTSVTDLQTTTTEHGTSISTNKSSIEQQANQILSKVEKDGVISAINQSAEEILIEAARILLKGKVTADDIEIGNNLKLGNELDNLIKMIIFNNVSKISGDTNHISISSPEVKIGDTVHFGFGEVSYDHRLMCFTSDVPETNYADIGGVGQSGLSGAVVTQGVRFSPRKTYTPSSIEFSPGEGNRAPQYTNLNSKGFTLYLEGQNTTGFVYWRGEFTDRK